MRNKVMVRYLIICILGCFSLQAVCQVEAINHLLVIKAYTQNNQMQKAIDYYGQIDERANNELIIMAVGNAYYKAKDYKNATNLYLEANNRRKNIANYELACCYAIMDKPGFSVKYLEQYLSQSNKLTISEIKSNRAFQTISLSKEWLGLWEQDWYSANDILYNDALYEFRIGNYNESENTINQLLKKRPSYHKAYHLLSKIKSKNERYGDALYNISQAVEIEPENAKYLYEKSLVLFTLEKYNKSLKAINQAISVDSSEVDYFRQKTNVLLKLNENELARKELEVLLNYTNSAIMYKLAGDTYFANKEYLISLKYYNKCFDYEPVNPDIFISRGEVYAVTGALEFAERDFSMALDFYPTNGAIYFKRGLVRVSKKNYDKACGDFNKALEFKYMQADDYIKRYCQY